MKTKNKITAVFLVLVMLIVVSAVSPWINITASAAANSVHILTRPFMEYNSISPLTDNLLIIGRINETYRFTMEYGVVDLTGNEIIPIEYTSIRYLNDIYILVENLNESDINYGVFDITGKEIISLSKSYREIEYLQDGLFIVGTSDRRYVVDMDGNEYFSGKTGIDYLGDGLFVIIETGNIYSVVDLKGNEIISSDLGYRYIYKISDMAKLLIASTNDYKYGVLNFAGDIVIPFEYYNLNFESCNFIANGGNSFQEIVFIKGKINRNDDRYYCYMADEKGVNITDYEDYKIKLNYRYEDYTEQYEDFAEAPFAAKKDGKWGYVNIDGSEVIPFEYDETDKVGFSDGLAVVKKDDKFGFIDINNKIVIPLEYQDANYFTNELAGVKKGGQWGVIDKSNKIIIDFTYAYTDVLKDKYILVKNKKEKVGVWCITQNKLVIPIKYDDIYLDEDFSDLIFHAGKFKESERSYSEKFDIFDFSINSKKILSYSTKESERSGSESFPEPIYDENDDFIGYIMYRYSWSERSDKEWCELYNRNGKRIFKATEIDYYENGLFYVYNEKKNGDYDEFLIDMTKQKHIIDDFTIYEWGINGNYFSKKTLRIYERDGKFGISYSGSLDNEVSVTGIGIKKELTLMEGQFTALPAIVYPVYSSNRKILWMSSNTDIANVNQNGKITAVSAGETIVMATTEDGGFTAQCVVTVTSDENKGNNRVVGSIVGEEGKTSAYIDLTAKKVMIVNLDYGNIYAYKVDINGKNGKWISVTYKKPFNTALLVKLIKKGGNISVSDKKIDTVSKLADKSKNPNKGKPLPGAQIIIFDEIKK